MIDSQPVANLADRIGVLSAGYTGLDEAEALLDVLARRLTESGARLVCGAGH